MKRKTHFTRKNYIAISLVFFWALFVLFAAACLDANNPVFKANNPIQVMGNGFGFPNIHGSFGAWVLVILGAVFMILFAAAFIFEMRLAKYYENKIWTKKWLGIYVATFFGCGIVCFGMSLIAQAYEDPTKGIEYNWGNVGNSFAFFGESLLIGTIIFVVLAAIVSAIVSLFVNFKNIDKPFRLFGKEAEKEAIEEAKREEEEMARAEAQGNLAGSFGEEQSTNGKTSSGTIGSEQYKTPAQIDDQPLRDKERIFPGLCTIDYAFAMDKIEAFEDSVDLKELCSQFRAYLAKTEGLYFSERTIRTFIAGLAASRLLILEGLSGTGKSSIARYFSEFISEDPFFEAVQATWRDKTSILGYYNDFSRTYNETEFLKRLYLASYKKNHINVMVLDEVNISRVEYYFADFLSVLEYPKDHWKLKIMQLPYDFDAPNHLEDGVLEIPENTWFIGTANKDDSTFTITDKVYDRAIVISFDDRNIPFDVNGEVKKVSLSHEKLQSLYNAALEDDSLKLTFEDKENFAKITNYIYDTFDLTFGNRIMRQIETLVPVFQACGGSKKEALDVMLAHKVLTKLQGRYEDFVKQGLIELKKLIQKVYGEDSFEESIHMIDKLLKKL
ncbi:MAG: hypothetical protein MJ241_01820 [Bacilli bacterium]|nr:hypothetical protein [Bacilli bacterium]